MSKKRYSVWPAQGLAKINGPDHSTWTAAREEYNKRKNTGLEIWNIWDHSTNPPTDVTDADPEAEPEMVWWWMESDGYIKRSIGSKPYIRIEYEHDTINAIVRKQFPIGHTPTIHDLNEALKPYNVQVPVPEEPKWWHRFADGRWTEVSDGYSYFKSDRGVEVTVLSTTANREQRYQQLKDAVEAVQKRWEEEDGE